MKKTLPFILTLLFIISCKKDDDTATPNNDPSILTAFVGDTITIKSENHGSLPIITFGDAPALVAWVSDTSIKVVVPDDIAAATVDIKLFSGNTPTVLARNFKLKAPVITSLSPDSGYAGKEITIIGKGFSKSDKYKKVTFGNKLLDAVDQSNNSIIIKIPDSTAVGKYDISVTVAGLTASASTSFKVIPFTPPTFTGFSPQTAFIGDTITLEGAHFGTDLSAFAAYFGAADARIVSVTENAISVVIPDEMEEASVQLKLNYNGTEMTATTNFQLKAPVIDSISVTFGFSGQFLSVYGKGFRKTTKTDQLIFGDKFVDAYRVEANNSALFIEVPQGLAAGKYPVAVKIAGMTATASDVFELIVPGIISFTPNSGSQYGKMIIKGTNLLDISGSRNTSVGFSDFQTGQGTKFANLISVTKDQIELYIPTLSDGRTYKVEVYVVSGRAAATEAFTYTR